VQGLKSVRENSNVREWPILFKQRQQLASLRDRASSQFGPSSRSHADTKARISLKGICGTNKVAPCYKALKNCAFPGLRIETWVTHFVRRGESLQQVLAELIVRRGE
jgi:hypothetical protein